MSLETLANQPDFPFEGFLDNEQQYAQSKVFWQKAFEEGLAVPRDKHDWINWMENPFNDGLPIWSLINKKEWIGMVVQQVARTEDPVWFKCWLNQANLGNDRVLPYLFVETFISQASYKIFVGLVRKWTAKNASIAQLTIMTDRVQQLAIVTPPSAVEK